MSSIEKEIKTRFVNNRQKAVINIMFSSNWIRNRDNAILSSHGISLQQYNILRILRGGGEKMNMFQVKDRMIDRSPNVTRLTDKLIDKSLIEKIRSEDDKRVIYIKITERGMTLLSKLDEPMDEGSKYFDTLSEEEAGLLSDLLDKLRL